MGGSTPAARRSACIPPPPECSGIVAAWRLGRSPARPHCMATRAGAWSGARARRHAREHRVASPAVLAQRPLHQRVNVLGNQLCRLVGALVDKPLKPGRHEAGGAGTGWWCVPTHDPCRADACAPSRTADEKSSSVLKLCSTTRSSLALLLKSSCGGRRLGRSARAPFPPPAARCPPTRPPAPRPARCPSRGPKPAPTLQS